MKVLFCSSEISPWVKTGGLADVSGALPEALEKLGVEIRLAMPRYKTVAGRRSPVAGRRSPVTSLKDDIEVITMGKNIPVYLIKNEKYFNRDGIYGDKDGDYPDNLERFSFFCRKILELLKEINFRPDIIHCNDWQTALIPVYLKDSYSKDSFYKKIKTLFTIHNLAYQGVFDKKEYPQLGLGWPLFGIEGLEFYHKINLLKGGLLFSDLLNTVSPSYAREIQTEELGCGLEGVLAKRKNEISGILNGLDYEYWNPATDGYIYKQYSARTPEDKYINKSKLLKECRLPAASRGFAARRAPRGEPSASPRGEPDTGSLPLLGMVGRLVMQKGLDLMLQSLEELKRDFAVQIVILGQGEKKYHNLLKEAVRKYPRHISLHTDFNEPLAHKIYAASDMFLMPSYYEPCGLGQMIALRYGTIPIVFKTGGLADTISAENGFVFDSYTPEAFLGALKKAISLYEDKNKWQSLVKKSFSYSFSWDESARKYAQLYKKLKDNS